MSTKRVSYREVGEWDVHTPINVDANGSESANPERITMAVLCVIRDELKTISRKLNALECRNFLAVPQKLDRIEKNTRKRKRPKVAGKPKLRVVR